MNNLNVKIDDIIHDNDISMYDVAVMENFKNRIAVITKHFELEIIVSI